ncbi:protein FAM3D isoform X1 [Hippopotamus amphibius kiboko]|uniref:protein FAM3D isoform X1 n=1 Tax=Hippopotamus amphibius kiboko TaxID=575201 RepID=UPI0025936AAD|nr:protein FAM3D isoform X1 [Hippopotamus amphibius kiboko]
MRVSGLRRLLALIFVLVTALVFVRSYINVNMKTIRLPRWMGSVHKEKPSQPVKTKCGLSTSCPDHSFAFKITSGAANVVGPSICFEDQTIMSPVKNNVGRGLNIALVNGTTGVVLTQKCFDMYSGDADVLVKFLKEIPEGTLVLVASYDDPGTKVNDDIKKLFSNLGSTYAKQLGFRDSWVFLGARDLKNKSPFEQFLKNNPENNKYEGWPELLEMGGCVPRKV